MGLTMSFTKVTPAELADLRSRDGAAIEEFLWAKDEAAEVSGYIDQAWEELGELFGEAEVPIDLEMGGDFIDEEGRFFAWSADLVAKTAERLRRAGWEALEPHLEPDWDADYVQEAHETLADFFEDAAASKAAAIMSFG